MSNYANRLKQFAEAFDTAKPVSSGDFAPLPDGEYQVKLTKGILGEVKKGKSKGQMCLDWYGSVIIGAFKGRRIFRRVNLEMQARENLPSGLSVLKGDFATLGVKLKSLDERSLSKVIRKLIGQNVQVTVKDNNGFVNVYFNKLIGDIQLQDDDLDPDDEDEFDNDSDEAMDNAPEDDDVAEDAGPQEPEEKPKKRRGRPKGSKNKAKAVTADDAPSPKRKKADVVVDDPDDDDDDDDEFENWDED